MSKPTETQNQPPELVRTPEGGATTDSLADLLEWFLKYDERTARMRHPHTDELFRWKQQDDKVNSVSTYPFSNAEERFAVGAIQALTTNTTEPALHSWITSLLEAIQEARTTRSELTDEYDLDANLDASSVERASLLPSDAEKRVYLTICWIEALGIAEVRFLGWVYQELYGRPFA